MRNCKCRDDKNYKTVIAFNVPWKEGDTVQREKREKEPKEIKHWILNLEEKKNNEIKL